MKVEKSWYKEIYKPGWEGKVHIGFIRLRKYNS